jgi:hypothetical protein
VAAKTAPSLVRKEEIAVLLKRGDTMPKIPRGGQQANQKTNSNYYSSQNDDEDDFDSYKVPVHYDKIKPKPDTYTEVAEFLEKTKRPMSPFERRVSWIGFWFCLGGLSMLILEHWIRFIP